MLTLAGKVTNLIKLAEALAWAKAFSKRFALIAYLRTKVIFSEIGIVINIKIYFSIYDIFRMVANDYQYILQNMQKELEVQAEKVGNLTKERDNAGKQIGAIEAQLSETKVVLDELGLKQIHFNIF